MNNMGAVQALGFVGPLLYFVFIILSTLRLDFWLSTFITGFVAAAELLGLALFHPAAQANRRRPDAGVGVSDLAAAPSFLPAAFSPARSACNSPAIRSKYCGGNRPRSCHQPVRPARFAPGGGAPAGRRLDNQQRYAAGRRHVRRHPGFTAAARTRTPQEVVDRLDAAFAVLVEIVDRNGGNREQVSRGTASWRCLARRSTIPTRHGAPSRRARNACRDRAAQYPQ